MCLYCCEIVCNMFTFSADTFIDYSYTQSYGLCSRAQWQQLRSSQNRRPFDLIVQYFITMLQLAQIMLRFLQHSSLILACMQMLYFYHDVGTHV